ncbi:hypothetical protein DICPUDRAFT_75060 [Dictyostelium purpureum]|uniref:Uncharacterized protein n=1 Tax=Dictyostelium purpureum TaxID=5786 RepID=F0Z9I7_DICPU|nr:uncharacterized protein DICPUDRAFT_75060 [Dictyostelium purpureum]EGC39416.1 hypothetical protein DICPUDRAFT_75060 [Dictyostelium purpureum]|eukprot:XP_003284090.1 hypothetical protein DICPUDRAFT_75060 [Dictyostelium purpureum]
MVMEKKNSFYDNEYNVESDNIPFIQISEDFEEVPISVKYGSNIETSNYEILKQVQNKKDFKYSLFFFLLGFLFVLPWGLNIKYLKSRNKTARKLSIVSIVLFIISVLVIVAIILYYSLSPLLEKRFKIFFK